MDWAIRQSRFRFDVRAEREEYERLFLHPARVLQDRLARRGDCDRTRQFALPAWQKLHLAEVQDARLLHQARVLGWGKEKLYYFAHTKLNSNLNYD